MKLYMPGEKGKAICEEGGRVSTTWRYRDVPFSDEPGVARKILAGVCDHCGKVVSIPPQSTPSIDPPRVGKTREMPEELAAEFRNAVDGYMKEGEGRPRRKRLGIRKAR